MVGQKRITKNARRRVEEFGFYLHRTGRQQNYGRARLSEDAMAAMARGDRDKEDEGTEKATRESHPELRA